MEETQIIQSLNILLYSRTLDTLYLEFNDAETKLLVTKAYVNTSAHTWLDLGMTLGSVEVMVKRNQENMQIIADFGLANNTGSTGIVQHMGHYVKIKKRFGNFQLLFQIHFRPKSSLNSLRSLTCKQDSNDHATHIIPRLSQYQQNLSYINQLKQIAQSNLSLITAKATSMVLNPIHRKKISLPSEQLNTRPFRKRKDKKTLTYNARINKLKKEEGKKTYMTPGGVKYKNRARSEKEMSGMTETVLEDIGDESVIGDRKSNGNTFILRKPKKPLEAYNNDDLSSSQATKQSFTRKAKSKNKITFLDTSLSIGTNYEQPPEPTLKKYFTQNQPIIQQRPNKFSHSIHQKIMQESCQNHGEMRQLSSAGNQNSEFFYEEKQKRMRDIQVRTENLYENLRVLCGKTDSRGISRVRDRSYERECGREEVSRSQQVSTEPHETNLIKRCSDLTRPSHKLAHPIHGRTSKFKQHFYEDLYLKTLESIQNQTQILHYVKAQCDNLTSFSIKRQKRQYTTVQRGKENINSKRKTQMMTKQRKMELDRKKKAEEGYLAKVEQMSMPVRYLK